MIFFQTILEPSILNLADSNNFEFEHMTRYFFWDPDRAMLPFNLPIIDRPILWYGFFFAFGFFLGYWILLYLLRRYLLTFPFFKREDIAKSGEFVSFLYKEEGDWKGKLKRAIWHEIDPKTKMQLSPGKAPSATVEEGLVRGLNKWVEQQGSLENKSWPKRISFLKGAWQKLGCLNLKKRMLARLLLEEIAHPGLVSLLQRAKDVAEKMAMAVIVGAVVGARLGDVLFYQGFEVIKNDPLSVFRIWEGGLASHGGAIGVLTALWIISPQIKARYQGFNFLRMLDLVAAPTALAGCFIRIGNFFNQEILGTATALPWGVVFGHPADGSVPRPRHPVQLYEAIFYLFLFFLLFLLAKRAFELKKPGKIFGLFLLLLFGFRFVIEFFKMEQSALLSSSYFTMGQYLSIPFIFLGVILYFRREK